MSLPPNWRNNLILERGHLGLGQIFLALEAIQTDGEVKGALHGATENKVHRGRWHGVQLGEHLNLCVWHLPLRGKAVFCPEWTEVQHNAPPAYTCVLVGTAARKEIACRNWAVLEAGSMCNIHHVHVGTWPSFQSCQLMESCSHVWPESGCVL